MASQLVDAVSNRDLPLVQLCVMLFAACYLALLLIADVITIAFNPKWRDDEPHTITRRFLMALSWSGRIGLLMSLFWILMALFGGYIAPHSGMDIGAGPILGGFSAENWLGTDYLGRDMLSRILLGARFSIGWR